MIFILVINTCKYIELHNILKQVTKTNQLSAMILGCLGYLGSLSLSNSPHPKALLCPPLNTRTIIATPTNQQQPSAWSWPLACFYALLFSHLDYTYHLLGAISCPLFPILLCLPVSSRQWHYPRGHEEKCKCSSVSCCLKYFKREEMARTIP